MKEIKAYIRRDRTNLIISKLESAGVKGMTVIDVFALSGWADKENFSYSIEYVEKYSTVVKLELICNDDDSDKLSGIIAEFGRTGKKGDGMIFISPVEKAIHIRTNEVNIL